MTYRELRADAELAESVACFWTSGIDVAATERSAKKAETSETTDAEEADDELKRVVPDGCMDIIWGPSGLMVAGPDTRAHLVPNHSGCYLSVRFRPGAAGQLFGVPANAMTDTRVPLRELRGSAYEWEPPTGLDDLHRLRDLIRVELRRRDGADPAIPTIRRAVAAGTPVPKIAADVGLSERTLRRRSIAAFGYAPKTLQRILRFQRALQLARGGMDLAQVAYECGYADQSHLASDVKELAGLPLTRLR